MSDSPVKFEVKIEYCRPKSNAVRYWRVSTFGGFQLFDIGQDAPAALRKAMAYAENLAGFSEASWNCPG